MADDPICEFSKFFPVTQMTKVASNLPRRQPKARNGTGDGQTNLVWSG